MEEQRRVNLSQFRSPQKSMRFLVKFTLYTCILGLLAFWIINRAQRKVVSRMEQQEIRGVRIETP